MHDEPEIIINGINLEKGDFITIRVALIGFALDLKTNGLGDDKIGKEMVELYLDRINKIIRIMGDMK